MTDQRASETDEGDQVLTALIATFNAAKAAVDAYRQAHAIGNADEWIPLKIAADKWCVSQDTARRRCQRGAGALRFGRWYVAKSAL